MRLSGEGGKQPSAAALRGLRNFSRRAREAAAYAFEIASKPASIRSVARNLPPGRGSSLLLREIRRRRNRAECPFSSFPSGGFRNQLNCRTRNSLLCQYGGICPRFLTRIPRTCLNVPSRICANLISSRFSAGTVRSASSLRCFRRRAGRTYKAFRIHAGKSPALRLKN